MPAESVTVIGAGAMGGWAALLLARRGHRVTLVDAWGPGNSRSSSGGDSRVIRGGYGAKGIYTAMVRQALTLWKDHLPGAFSRLFHPTGFLWLVNEDDSYVAASRAALDEHGFPLREYTPAQLRRHYPQVNPAGISGACFEETAGYMLARRGCEAVTNAFIESGGRYLQRAVAELHSGEGALQDVQLSDGRRLRSDWYVFACGPWLPSLFPDELGPLIRPRRQEVFYFGPPAGDPRFTDEEMPAWAEVGPPSYYGVPGSERRGFKIADDVTGPVIDPTTMERHPTAETLESVRRFMAFRFPAMEDAPLLESRVCQYSMTPDRDLILDFHPRMQNVFIAGGGSGHAYKLGPAIGQYACGALCGKPVPEMFGLERFRKPGRRSSAGMFS